MLGFGQISFRNNNLMITPEWLILADLIEFLENIDERLAAMAFILIMIIQSPLLTFPGYLLMIYAGFRFGFIAGTLINFFGLYTSCIIGYRFGRWGSSDLSKNLSPRIQKIDDLIKEKGINIVIFLRILPLIPNNITSIGSGFARVSEKQHALFSGLSLIQSCFWSFLGSNLLNNRINDLELEINKYHGILLMLLIMFMLYVKYRFNSNSEVTDIV